MPKKQQQQQKNKFVPKTDEEIAFMLGKDLPKCSKEQQLWFSEKAPANSYTRITSVEKGEWIEAYPEDEEENYATFLKQKHCRPVTAKQNTIYILPLDFTKEQFPLTALADYVGKYFHGTEVSMLDPVECKFEIEQVKQRVNGYTKTKQYNTRSICKQIIQKKIMPKNAYCLIAITLTDLYPEESWNFCFGEADMNVNIAMFSFARYDPEFPKSTFMEGKASAQAQLELFKQSCSVCVHELGHLFGHSHCKTWYCLMNGSNSLEESNKQPMHLCPLCLRKLHHTVGFNAVERYKQLESFYKNPLPDSPNSTIARLLFVEELAWVRNRIKAIEQQSQQQGDKSAAQ